MSRKKQSPIIEALEPRLLYSADPIASLFDLQTTDSEDNDDNSLLDAAEHQALRLKESSELDTDHSYKYNSDSTEDELDVDRALSSTSAAGRLEIVFVDTSTADYQQLLDDLLAQGSATRSFEVFTIDKHSDGVHSISESLAGFVDIDAVHIISHASDGVLALGNSRLDASSLQQHEEQIAQWSKAFSNAGDILFYGCDLASDEAGRQLVADLAALTKTDIAASDDLSGHSSLNADWELEHQVGSVESELVFTQALQADWQHTLDISSDLILHHRYDSGADDSSGNNIDGTLSNGASIDNSAGNQQVGAGKLSLDGVDDYVDLSSHSATFSTLTEGTIAAWIRTTESGESVIFGASDAGDSLSLMKLSVDGGNLKWLNLNDAGDDVIAYGVSNINDGNWHHVAVTVGATGNQLYVDGALEPPTYLEGDENIGAFFDDINDIDEVNIGRSVRDNTADFPFDGLIDDARIYSRALSSDDISTLYEAPPPASDLSSGIELNTDAGNDAYLISSNGGAILGGLSELSVEVSFATSHADEFTLLSYRTPSDSNGSDDFRIIVRSDGELRFSVNGDTVHVLSSAFDFNSLRDGQQHQLAFSWDNTHGAYAVFVDGQQISSGDGIAAGETVRTGGTLTVGQEQDSVNGGFDNTQAFHGTVYDLRIWDDVRSAQEIALNHQHKIDSNNLPSGLVANWQMDGFNGSNEVVDIVSGNNLSVAHASGTGFSDSTPVADLHAKENAASGTSVGFVNPSNPETPEDIVKDGRFLEAPDAGSYNRYTAGQSFGEWTVRSGSIDLLGSFAESSPLGGRSVELAGNNTGGIYQTLNTVAGQQYQVIFALSGNWNAGDSVKDLRVSANGFSQDYAISEPDNWSSGSNMMFSNRSFTFTASSSTTDLDFLSLDAGDYASVIADISVVTVPEAVATILSNDDSLVYDAATAKFYRSVASTNSWYDAQAAAVAANLNGVAGQLLTIKSVYENDLATQFAIDLGGAVWLGATDQSSEGTWRWQEGGEDGEIFWTGDNTGSAPNGVYTNWTSTEPNDWSLGEDHMELFTDGSWNDANGSATKNYIVEWDANEVLSSSTFSLSDNAGGRFAIDESSGEIIVDDSELLDYETSSSHDITVRVANAGGQFYDEVMAVAIDNQGGEPTQQLPAAQSVAENQTLTFNAANGNAVTVSDTDDNSDTRLQVSLSVNDGILSLSQTTGLSILDGADNSSALTFHGTESAINAALEGMTFTPDSNFNGSVSLQMSTSLGAELVGHYSFDASDTRDDSAGTSHDGSLQGNASTVTDATRGEVLSLDGDGDYVEISGLMGEPSDVTLAAWINTSSVDTAGAAIISMGQSPALYLDASGKLVGEYEHGGSNTTATSTNSLLGTGWRHVAVSIDSTSQELTLYLDGSAIETLAATAAIEYDNGTNTYIGRVGNSINSHDFNGKIDDARLYSRALSDDEIAALAKDIVSDSDTLNITVTAVNNSSTFIRDNGPISFVEHDISITADGAVDVTTADLDGDGDLDVLSAAYIDDKIVWYENNGSQSFTAHVIDANADYAGTVFAEDLDGDGDLDVLATSYNDDTIAWHENDGNQNFTKRIIDDEAGGPFDVETVDMDGDGDLDLVATNFDYDVVSWYENDGNQNFTGHIIDLSSDQATAAVSADLDGDGDIDVLSASRADDKFSWYENDGSQNFTAHNISTTAAGAFDITAVDMDGDGDLDVLTASRDDDTVAWYENDGSENFTRRVITANADSAHSAVAADIDNDGDLDVVTASILDNTVAWYENDGSQNFTEHNITTSAMGAFTVTTADVDGDGDLDVLSASRDDDRITWHELSGGMEHTLQNNPSYIENGPAVVLDSDVDISDPELDLLDGGNGNYSGASVTLARNGGAAAEDVFAFEDGNGITLSGANLIKNGQTIASFDTTTTAGQLRILFTDANGEIPSSDDADYILSQITYANSNDTPPASVQIDWTFSDGNSGDQGTGGESTVSGSTTVAITAVNDGPIIDTNTGTTVNEGVTGTVITSAMLSGSDGDDDDAGLVYTLTAAPTNGSLYNNGVLLAANDTFTQADLDAGLISYDHDGSKTTADSFDFSLADGGEDGAVPATGTFNLNIYPINTGPSFVADDGPVTFTEHQISNNTSNPFNITTADLDGDGDLDVLAASRGSDEISWFENDGNENFSEHVLNNAANTAVSVTTADLDGDGDLDVLSASIADDKLLWYENDGNQNFTIRTVSLAADGPTSVTVADLDGDGNLDVLSASQNDRTIAWYKNDGNENFTKIDISTAARTARSVTVADVDGDGDLDVLSASESDDKIAWYENDGNENFTAHTISTQANGAFEVTTADVDGDGDLDVLSASWIDDKIAWYENDGNQNFTTHIITLAEDAYAVTTADIDGDGDLDVFSASFTYDTIAWYENDGNQNFTLQTVTTSADGARDVAVADLDGDGDLDVLSAAGVSNIISWHEVDGGMQNSLNGNATYIEGGSPVVIDNDVNIMDAELDSLNSGNGNYSGASLTLLRNGGANSEDLLGFSAGNGITLSGATLIKNGQTIASFDTTTTAGQLSIVFTDANGEIPTSADVDNILSQLTYANSNDTPPASVQIDWTFNDGNSGAQGSGGAASTTGSTTVNITATNDGPSIVNNTGVTADEGSTGSVITSTMLSGSDVDDDDASLVYTLTAAPSNGTLKNNGVVLTTNDTFSQADLDAGLITYDHDGSNTSSDSFDFSLADGGEDGAAAATGTFNFSFNPVNSDPSFLSDLGSVNFSAHDIDTAANGAYDVTTADMDGDGDLDVVSALYVGGDIVWYENDGSESFTAHTISAAANGATSVTVADVDGDGDLDVLSASYDDNKIAWYENDGNQNFTTHNITTSATNAKSVTTADVDGDGDMDVLSASTGDNKIVWYENNGSQNFTAHTITAAANNARDVHAVDVDGDGDMDVLSASWGGNQLAWYENDGSENFTTHIISSTISGAAEVTTLDMDGDGDLDVLSASTYDDTIAWYENDGSQNFTFHTIATSADEAVSVSYADVDGDGDLDVLSASINDDKIAWYENDGNQNFKAHIITTSADLALAVAVADVDGDGDMDALSASLNDNTIAWYELSGGKKNSLENNPTFVEDGAAVVLDNDVDISDPELDALNGGNGNYSGASLTLLRNGGANSEDLLAFSAGNGITLSGASLIKNGQAIASFDTTTTAGQLSIVFTDANGEIPTSADVDNILSQLTYANSNDTPPASVQIDWTFNDGNSGAQGSGGAASTTGSTTVNITATNDGPSIVNNTGVTADEGSTGSVITSTMLSGSDVDDDDASLVYTLTAAPSNGTLKNNGVVLATNDTFSQADLDAGLITYDHDGSNTSSDSFDFSLADGGEDGATAATGTFNFSFSPVNSGPSFISDDGPISFTEHDISTDTDSAADVVTVDLDGDGDIDVLSLSYAGNKVLWFENDGSQNFTKHTITTTAGGPWSVTAADMDGDGDLDVLSANYTSNSIYWYENDGSENFTAHTITTVTDAPISITTADMDGDGDLDVLSASYDDDKIAWFENNGDTTFTAHTITTSANGAWSVSSADVDGDGDLDVLSASELDNKIAWYENDGNQNFTAHTITSTASGAQSVTTADVDGDGDIDVLSAWYGDNKIVWHENDGSENFTTHTITTAASGATDVTVADVDGDGDIDVFSASKHDDKIAWYENDGSQNFTTHVITTAADFINAVAVGDVDSDGDLDVLSASGHDDTIAWYEVSGGNRTSLENNPTFVEDGAAVVLDSDVNIIDPELDALNGGNGNYSGASLTLLRNGGANSEDLLGFSAGNGITLSGANLIKNGQAIASFDTTSTAGQLSIVFTDGNGEIPTSADVDNILSQLSYANSSDTPSANVQIDWTFNDGNTGAQGSGGALSTTGSTTVNITATNDGPSIVNNTGAAVDEGSTGTVITSAMLSGSDVDDDDASLTYTLTAAPSNGTLKNNGVPLASNDTFSQADLDAGLITYNHNGSNTSSDSFDFSLADGGEDGASAAAATFSFSINAVNSGPSFISFTEHEISTSADYAYEVATADLDGDGDLDVLSASFNDDKIAWYENDGSQNFTAHTITTAANGAYSVAIADVDGDGDMDVLSASFNDNKIAWYENDGSQNFTAHTITTAANGARSVITADVDGDGDIDVLSASIDDDKIAWYENDGNQNFTAHTITTAANGAQSVAIADVDGDGDIDVLSASYHDKKIAWYENDGSENFTARTISTSADGARSVATADVDGDGDMDVLSASQTDDKIAWYENNGSENFTAHTVSTAANGAYSVTTADVDGDGNLDVLSASVHDDTIAWYELDRGLGQPLNNSPTYVENGAAVLLDSNVKIIDTELDAFNGGNGNYSGASLTLLRNGGANSEDLLGFSAGNGITLSGANLIKNGQAIANFDTTSTAGQLSIVFTDANGEIPTSADVDNILSQITYANSSDTPSASVQIDWTFNDGNTGAQGSGGAASTTGSTTVNITAVNDLPVADLNGSDDAGIHHADTFTEGDSPVKLTDSDATISDVDNTSYTSLMISLSGLNDGNDEVIRLNAQAFQYGVADNINTTVGSTNFEIDFDGADFRITEAAAGDIPEADLQALLHTISYANTSQAPTEGDRSFAFITTDSDGGVASPSSVSTITVAAVNDAPVLDNSGDLTLTTISEDDINNAGQTVASILASDGGSPITDVDGSANQGIAITAHDSVAGTWQYSIDGGSTWSDVGAVAESSALLLRDSDLLRVNPDGVNGSNTKFIDFRAWDQSSGSAGSKVDVSTNGGSSAFSSGDETATIEITDVNDAPVLDDSWNLVLGSENENSGAPSGMVGTLISHLVSLSDNVSDVDTGAVTGIAVTAADTSNGSWWFSTDNGSNWTALGSVSDSNARLLSDNANTRLYFYSDANYNGTINDAITFHAWDQSTGSNGSLADISTIGTGGSTAFSTASDSASITISPINTDPSNSGTLVSDVSVIEDSWSTIDLSAVEISDVDAASGDLTLTLSTSTGGQLNAAADASIDFTGTSTTSVVMTGTLAELNAYLDVASNLSYLHSTAELNGNAADTLSLTINDNGNTGNGGGADVALGSVNVNITAVNDAPTLAGTTTLLFSDSFETPDVSGRVDADPTGWISDTHPSYVAHTDEDSADFSTPYGDQAVFVYKGSTIGATTDASALSQTLSADAAYKLSFNVAREGTVGAYTVQLLSIAGDNSETVLASVSGTATETDFSESDYLEFSPDGSHTAVLGDRLAIRLLQDPSSNFAHSVFFDNVQLRENVTTYAEDGPAVVLGEKLQASDNELDAANAGSGNYAGASVSIARDSGANSDDVFAFNDGNGITLSGSDLIKNSQIIASLDSTTTAGQLDISFTDANGEIPTSADVDNILQQITYANSSDTPPASVQINVALDDGNSGDQGTGAALSVIGSMTVDIVAANDNPSNSGSLPSDITVVEDVSSDVDLSSINLSDADHGGGDLTVKLNTATGGLLSASSGAGVTVVGSGSGSVTLTGSLANLNSFLDNSSNIQYVHGTANTFGNDADSIEVLFNDNGNVGSGGGTDQNLGSVNVDITAVNDEQTLSTNTGTTVLESSSGNVISSAMLETIDVDNTAAQLTYSLSSVPANGTLYRNAVALSAADTFTQADIDAGLISYDHDGSETLSDSFNFSVDDGTGTSSNGTFNLTITAVNDAPVANADSFTVDEGSTTVLDLADNDTDADDGLDLSSISIISGPSNGSLVVNANGTVEYTHDGSETVADSFSYSIDDNTGTSSNTVTVSLTVTPVNDLPIATGNTVYASEDVALVFSVSDFNYNDAEGDALSSITISSLSLNGGTLTHSAGAVTVTDGMTITAAQLADLTFTSALNDSTNSSFSYTVNDADNGVTAALMTIDVSAVNDVPVATGNTVTTDEDVALVIDASDFSFTDVEDDDLASVTITGLNLNGGTLTHTGGTVDVTNGMTITAAQLADLTFTSALNDSTNSSFSYTVNDADNGVTSAVMNITVNAVNDVPVATGNTVTADEDVPLVIDASEFSFTDVEDDDLESVTITGLNLNGGTLTHTGGTVNVTNGMTVTAAQLADLTFTSALNDSTNSSFSYTVNDADNGVTAAVMNITVNAVNDVPVATGNTVTTDEDVALVIDASDFNYTDVEDDDLESVTITGLNLNGGTLTHTGGTVNVTNGMTVTAAQLADLTFKSALNDSTNSSFSYTVNDADNGVTAAVMNITVNAVNDVPVATGNTVTTDEDVPLVFTAGDFSFTDVEDDDLESVTITGLNLNGGTLTHTGGTVSVTNGMTVTAAQLADLTFTSALHDSTNSSFSYTVNDADNGVTAAVMNITVNAVNDVPVATGNTVTADEDVPLVIDASDFSFTDVEDDDLESVTITGLNLNGGTLTHTGGTVDVTNGMTVTAAQLADLTFKSALNDSTNSSFSYTVNDADNGVTAALMNITVNAVNDVPVATGNTVTTDEDVPLIIDASDFSFTDIEDDDLESVTITGLNLNGGTLTHTGGTVNVTNGMTITAAQLADLTFTSALNDSTNSSFSYTVNDADVGTVSASMNITVNAVNDVPVAIGNTVTTDEDVPLVIDASDFSFTDIENDNLESVTITGLNLNGGTLTHTGGTVNVVNGMTITAAQLADLTFTSALHDSTNSSFSYTVNDADNGVTSAVMNITVNAVNDVPVATGNTVTADEDVPLVIDASDFSFTDIENDDLVSVTVTGLNLNGGTLTHTGGSVSVTNGMTITAAQLADLTFTSALNDSSNSSFSYTVNDAGNGVTSALMNITVNAVNDVPVADGNTIVSAEDTPVVFTTTDFAFTDVENDSLVSVTLTALNLNGGTLSHSAGTVPVTEGMTITAAELADLTYIPALNAVGNASFNYTVNDADAGIIAAAMDIVVYAVNDAPVATGNSLTVEEDHALVIDAAKFLYADVEFDALQSVTVANLQLNGGTLTHSAGTVTVSNGMEILAAELLDLTFTPAPHSNLPASFEYWVNDDDNGVVGATLNITVTPLNDAPIITSNGGGDFATVQVPENDEGASTVVTTDHDNTDTIDYAIDGGADANLFSIDRVSGELTFNQAPNFENPQDSDQDNAYEVVVSANDGNGGVDQQTLSIIVLNENESPRELKLSGQEVESLTNTAGGFSLGQLSAFDEDFADTMTFSLVGGADVASFSLSGDQSNTLLIDDGIVNSQQKSSYEIIVRATDAAGASVEGVFTITVTPSQLIIGGEQEEITPTVPTVNKPAVKPTDPDLLFEEFQSVPALSLVEKAASERANVTDPDPIEVDEVVLLASELNVQDMQGASLAPGQNTLEPLKFLDLLNLDLAPLDSLGTPRLAALSFEEREPFISELNRMSESVERDLEQQQQKDLAITEITSGITLGLTAGYVSWVLNSGTLMASILSAMPVWKKLDPLLVLAAKKRQDDEEPTEENEEEKRISAMFD